MKNYYIYIMSNFKNGTLYIGVTSDLLRRVTEHKSGASDGFTKAFGLKRLIYFEETNDIRIAIQREKNLKAWKRRWKLKLINGLNPEWEDLYLVIAV